VIEAEEDELVVSVESANVDLISQKLDLIDAEITTLQKMLQYLEKVKKDSGLNPIQVPYIELVHIYTI
jgi:prefoldin subunit 5